MATNVEHDCCFMKTLKYLAQLSKTSPGSAELLQLSQKYPKWCLLTTSDMMKQQIYTVSQKITVMLQLQRTSTDFGNL